MNTITPEYTENLTDPRQAQAWDRCLARMDLSDCAIHGGAIFEYNQIVIEVAIDFVRPDFLVTPVVSDLPINRTARLLACVTNEMLPITKSVSHSPEYVTLGSIGAGLGHEFLTYLTKTHGVDSVGRTAGLATYTLSSAAAAFGIYLAVDVCTPADG